MGFIKRDINGKIIQYDRFTKQDDECEEIDDDCRELYYFSHRKGSYVDKKCNNPTMETIMGLFKNVYKYIGKSDDDFNNDLDQLLKSDNIEPVKFNKALFKELKNKVKKI